MYAPPIDISSFTDFEDDSPKNTRCVFALDMGGSLTKLSYQTSFRYKVIILSLFLIYKMYYHKWIKFDLILNLSYRKWYP